MANMQLNAYNYFKKMNQTKLSGAKVDIIIESYKNAEDSFKMGRDTPKDDETCSIALSPTKIEFLKQIPRDNLVQAGFGDLNLENESDDCLLYTSPSPRDATLSRMPSSA